MLSLEKPPTSVGTLTIFADHADPVQFYYAAPEPTIARTGGQPMFDLFTYAVELAQSPLKGTTIPAELGAGFLTMGVECTLSDDKHAAAVQKLGGLLDRDPDTISLSPIPYVRGSVSVIALDLATVVPPGGPTITPGRPRFVESMVGGGTPSLLGGLRSIFSFGLSQDGATFLEALFKDGAAPVGVVYDLTFLGLRPSVQAHVHADVSQVYRELGGSASVGCPYIRAEVEGTLSDLVQKGVVTIELTSQAMGEEAARSKELALSLFKDKIIQELYQPSPGMPNLTMPAIPGMPPAQAPKTSIVTLSLKAKKEEELRVVDYDFSERSPEERTHAPQGFLATLLSKDEVAARTHKVDLASPFFELLEVLVTGPSPEEMAALSLTSVTVDLAYGKAGDAVAPETGSLVFRRGGPTDLTWAVRRKGRSTLAYTAAVTYEFTRSGSVDATSLTYTTGPRPESGRTLSVRPYDDLGVLDVEVDTGHLGAGVTDVDVTLDYADKASGFTAHQQMRLAVDPVTPVEQRRWQVRTGPDADRHYTAAAVLTFDDASALTLPPVVTDDALLRVDGPFHGTRSLLVQPNVTTEDVSAVTVEVTYDDDKAGYHRRFSRTLAPTPPPPAVEGQPAPPPVPVPLRWQPVTLSWPVLDAAAQEIRYRVTTAAGGVIDTTDWEKTTDPSILVGSTGSRMRSVEVRLVGPPLAEAGLDAVQVRVAVAGAPDDTASSAFFDPTTPVAQTLSLAAGPDAAPGFRSQTTSFRADGTQRQSAWTDSTGPFIAVSTRTV
ncbi:hypothetical protein [Cellulomonas sp. ICMP 17802]|uniref:hypothetical protein n=1 Tax=Cellulomonas sp. ICMP 17802 TaxID=3239199 RepID=UPI00351BE968